MSTSFEQMSAITEDIYRECEPYRMPATDMLIGSKVSYFLKPPIIDNPLYFLGDLLIEDIRVESESGLSIVFGFIKSDGEFSGPYPINMHNKYAVTRNTQQKIGFFCMPNIDAEF